MATLITAKEVISKAPLGQGNYPPQNITPHIMRAEWKHIRELLGKDYYDALVTEADGDATTNLAGDNATLWEMFLHDLCAYSVMYEALPFVWLDVSGKGIMRVGNAARDSGSGDNVTAAASDVQMLKANYHEAISNLQASMDCWLKEQYAADNTKYADYQGNITGCSRSDSERFLTDQFGIVFLDDCETDND